MMKRILATIKGLLLNKNKQSRPTTHPVKSELLNEDLFAKLEMNCKQMRALFANQFDFVERSIQQTTNVDVSGTLFFFDSLIDLPFLEKHVLQAFVQLGETDVLHVEQQQATALKFAHTFAMVEQSLKEGYAALFMEGEQRAVLIHAPRNLARAIEDPINEFVSRGPRDGFSEDITLNVGLIRKRLRGSRLMVRQFILGSKSQTTCVVVYVAEIAATELIDGVCAKMAELKTNAVFDSGELEELLASHPFSPFDEFMNTERADKVAAELLEGRIAILVDGSPTAIIGPATFFNLLSSPDDHYQRFLASSLHRWLRFGGFLLSAHLSALYLSLVTYHAHLIPIKLVEILMSKREQVPFPPLFEIIIMQIMIDLVLEAILRLPTKLGQIIGVAGAIVIGQAAISANLISPGVIIVVSITTITGFAMPRLSTAYSVQVLRYANLLLASLFGGFGMMVSLMFWLIHLCHLHPLGKAYLSPLAPFKWHDMRDMIFRFPKWLMTRQPDNPGARNPMK